MQMQFSQEFQKSYFFSQPHQPFFVLAFITAIVSMLIFLFAYQGALHIAIKTVSFHAYSLTYLLFTPAFFGFLFTTFPRFSSTPALDKKTYIHVFNFYYMGATFFLLGSIVSPLLSIAGMIITAIGQTLGVLILKNIYTRSTLKDTQDIFWILLAMGIGVIANFLFIIGEVFTVHLIPFSIELSTYLYLFFVAFTVAQRMVPFFSHIMVAKNTHLLKYVFILLVFHVVLESFITHSSFIVDLLLGLLLAKEFKRWKLPFPNPNPLLWILHVALYWSAFGFILVSITHFVSLLTGVDFFALEVHLILLGFVFTILIGFGTRVTLGHSGNQLYADKWTTLLFYGTQLIVILRILTSFVYALHWHFMPWFESTAIAWIGLFIIWALRYFDVLIRGKK